MDDRPRALLTELTRRLARSSPQQPLALRLCSAYVELVSAQGGAITFKPGPSSRVTLCATDDVAAEIEEMQEVIQEGPSLEVLRFGADVSGLDASEQRARWPMLFDLLPGGEVGTMHAFAMRPDSTVMGVVTVYQGPSSPGRLGVSDAEAQFLADAVAVALLGDLGTHSVPDEAWTARDRVDQATGMVVAQLRVSATDALAVLRAHAFAHATTLHDVSTRVLQRRLDFSEHDASDGAGTTDDVGTTDDARTTDDDGTKGTGP
jgi:hypothetical protein